MRNNKIYIKYLFFYLLVYIYSLPKYTSFLPTIPIYNNNEANSVLKQSLLRNAEDIEFFNLTDPSVCFAYLPYVNESIEELNKIVTQPIILFTIFFFKYIINRPRPYQINKNIEKLNSNTDKTPSYPAGHAFQAYALTHVLKKKYKNKDELFDNISVKCDETRIKGGIHYKSDGEFSKILVDILIKLQLL